MDSTINNNTGTDTTTRRIYYRIFRYCIYKKLSKEADLGKSYSK